MLLDEGFEGLGGGGIFAIPEQFERGIVLRTFGARCGLRGRLGGVAAFAGG